MPAPIELPMALSDCGLDEAQLAEQLERYRRLGAAAERSDRSELALTVRFGALLDPELLDQTIAVERQCCSFFALDYDAARRQLTVRVDDPARAPALDVIAAALSSGGAPGRRDGR